MKIISRQEAKQAGLARYFTGQPCKRGHVAEGKVNNLNCVKCLLIVGSEWKKKHPEKCREQRNKWNAANREHSRKIKRSWNEKNRKHVKEQQAERSKRWREANRR